MDEETKTNTNVHGHNMPLRRASCSLPGLQFHIYVYN